MKTKTILAGLERLEEEPVVPVEGEPTESETAELLTQFEEQNDITEEEDEIEQKKEDIEEAEASIETLMNIHSMIEKHGLSKSMMMMADPNNELSEAGIVPSYESLSNTPTKDKTSSETTDALVGRINAGLESIVASVEFLFNLVLGSFIKFLKRLDFKRDALKSALKRLSSIKYLDKSELSIVKHNVYPRGLVMDEAITYLEKTGKTFLHMADTAMEDTLRLVKDMKSEDYTAKSAKSEISFYKKLEAENKNITKFLGRNFRVSKGELSETSKELIAIKMWKVKQDKVSVTLDKTFCKDKNSIKSTLESAFRGLDIRNEINVLRKKIEVYEIFIKTNENNSVFASKERRLGIRIMRNAFYEISWIITRLYRSYNSVTSEMLYMANDAITEAGMFE